MTCFHRVQFLIVFTILLLLPFAEFRDCYAQNRKVVSADSYFDILDARFYLPIGNANPSTIASTLHPSKIVTKAVPRELALIIEQQLGFPPKLHFRSVNLEMMPLARQTCFTYRVRYEIADGSGGQTGIAPICIENFDAISGQRIALIAGLTSKVPMLDESDFVVISKLQFKNPIGQIEISQKVEWNEMAEQATKELEEFLQRRKIRIAGERIQFRFNGRQAFGSVEIPYVAAKFRTHELRYYYISRTEHSVFDHEESHF